MTLRDGHSPALTCEDYTIAWICALHLELHASRAMLDKKHPTLPVHEGDSNTYVLGRMGHHNVVMVCLPGQYGTVKAARVATDLKRTFPCIRATLMVGIGGGCPGQGDIYLGDVVVGTRVMQYDLGKSLRDGNFQITDVPKIPEPVLNSAVTNLRSSHGPHGGSSHMASILRDKLPETPRPDQPDLLFAASYEHAGGPTCASCDRGRLQPRGVRLSPEPRIHYGVIASGNKLIKHAETRDKISGELSALCFEMEAAGIMDILHCLPIRGICDYSDSHKTKKWQHYAAATAAAYARELLEVLPGSVRSPGSGTSSTWDNPDYSGNTIPLSMSFDFKLDEDACTD